MGIVTFTIPDEVKEAFDKVFDGDDAVKACRAGDGHLKLARSRPQQDRQGLRVGDFGPGREFGRGAAADRMGHDQERIAGQPQDTGDVLRRHLERFGAQHDRPLAQLLECDAVVQTAR